MLLFKLSFIDHLILSSEFCVMNGKYYTPGQTWDDGCDKKCVCEDGTTGPHYTCLDRYPTCTNNCFLRILFYISFESLFKPMSYKVLLCPPNRRLGGTYCFWCRSSRHLRCFLSAFYLLNQWVDFEQTCRDTLFGEGIEVIRFW